MDLCFSHSLHQLIAETTRTTDRTKTLRPHFNEFSRKRDSDWRYRNDHELIYLTRKTSFLKLNEYYEVWVRSMKNHEQLRAIKFSGYSNYTTQIFS